ncbi:hypothetical protein AwDysgo_12120 [Bacteroidales bacterium]|nr:hypothetical protein AwDysgo_12120 [Bacteroidales bacterium]
MNISKNKMLKKILFSYILVSSFIFCASAQKQKVKNQPYADQRIYHFGLSVGFNMQDLLLTNSGHVGDGGEIWYGEITNYSGGFNVGMVTDLYLNPMMNLRLTPSLHFGDKNISFIEEKSGEIETFTIRSNYLSFPLDVKFNSMRLNNYRPYFLAGAYGALDVGRKKDMPILLSGLDYGIQFGIGCDFYLPMIKIGTELRFYFGLTDILVKDRPDLLDKTMLKYTQALSRSSSRMIVLSFNFE